MHSANRIALLVALAAMSSACSKEAPPPTAAAPSEPPAEVAAAPEPAPAEQPVAHELADTSWQLVQIKSMDDTTLTPSDASKYTLTITADNSMKLVGDCNRGAGAWKSESAGQLEFGPIATTRAMCSPESISSQYVAQFAQVRSYQVREGHLFLATMADGSILEFEPVAAP